MMDGSFPSFIDLLSLLSVAAAPFAVGAEANVVRVTKSDDLGITKACTPPPRCKEMVLKARIKLPVIQEKRNVMIIFVLVDIRRKQQAKVTSNSFFFEE